MHYKYKGTKAEIHVHYSSSDRTEAGKQFITTIRFVASVTSAGELFVSTLLLNSTVRPLADMFLER
jgi:hypothetical protein